MINRDDIDLESFNGANILITGGTGSFGHAFVERLLSNCKPNRLAIFSRDELKQYEMAQRISPDEHSCIRYFIGDVRDVGRLEMAMRGIDIVIHAAALKHVPIAEYNPFECIHTNVIGAENVVRAALRNKVKKVLALSTDKAANPANLYGASKLASDKIFTAANALSGDIGSIFSVVRYGNVSGSRGSVVPFFKKLAANPDAEIPITDPRMTRFWITLPQGVDFVLWSLSQMMGGEIFVPKIPSVRIVELAHAIAPGRSQKIVGIRPGEKLHEVMITEDDSRDTVDLGPAYAILPIKGFGKASQRRTVEANFVEDGFRYASNTNTDWLNSQQICQMLSGLDASD